MSSIQQVTSSIEKSIPTATFFNKLSDKISAKSVSIFALLGLLLCAGAYYYLSAARFSKGKPGGTSTDLDTPNLGETQESMEVLQSVQTQKLSEVPKPIETSKLEGTPTTLGTPSPGETQESLEVLEPVEDSNPEGISPILGTPNPEEPQEPLEDLKSVEDSKLKGTPISAQAQKLLKVLKTEGTPTASGSSRSHMPPKKLIVNTATRTEINGLLKELDDIKP